jgi:hypothetical protein
MKKRICFVVFLAVLSSVAAARIAAAQTTGITRGCKVVDGVVTEVALGPFLPAANTVTTKASWTAEFRWDVGDIEAIGWMRISDDKGQEVGWVPAGHEAVQCGQVP